MRTLGILFLTVLPLVACDTPDPSQFKHHEIREAQTGTRVPDANGGNADTYSGDFVLHMPTGSLPVPAGGK
jgi:hypothetical protein